jgi:hypothetical protein
MKYVWFPLAHNNGSKLNLAQENAVGYREYREARNIEFSESEVCLSLFRTSKLSQNAHPSPEPKGFTKD